MDSSLGKEVTLKALSAISFFLLPSVLPISWAVGSDLSPSSALVRVDSAAENRAPSMPEVVLKSVAGSSVALEWQASKDDDTAEEQITYQVYYAEGTPVGSMEDLELMWQGVGVTSYTAEDLPYSTKVNFYLAAVDQYGASSTLSGPVELETGDSGPTLRDGINLVDLEEIGAIIKKQSANTLIVTNPSELSQDIDLDDVLVSYDEDPFIGKVVSISQSGKGQSIRIEPMLLHEILSSGSFQMEVKSHSVRDSSTD